MASTYSAKLAKKSEQLVRYARSPEYLSHHLKRSMGRMNSREVQRERRQRAWKRDLSLRANGTVDPWYGCNLLDMLVEYAVNYTFPWSKFWSREPSLSHCWRSRRRRPRNIKCMRSSCREWLRRWTLSLFRFMTQQMYFSPNRPTTSSMRSIPHSSMVWPNIK